MRIIGLCALLTVGCHSETTYVDKGHGHAAGAGGLSAGGGAGVLQGGTSGRASGGGSARGGSGAGDGGSGAEAGSSGEAGDSNGGVGATGGGGTGGGIGESGSSGASGSGGVTCSGRTLHADVVITKQSELEAIQGYGTIDGNLQIVRDVSDLTPLACLKRITGDFTLFDTDELASLAGLDALTRVDGNLHIGRCQDSEDLCPPTDHLTSLEGLGALTTVGGWLRLENTSITDVDGLTSLTQAGGLILDGNEEFSSLEGFRGLAELPIGLYLFRNPLTTLSGLENVTQMGDLALDGPFSSLDALRSLVTVTDSVSIAETQLVSLHGLEGLESIGGVLAIGTCSIDYDFRDTESCEGNDELVDIDALSNLRGSMEGIVVAANPLLKDLDALSGIIATNPSTATILYNDALTQIDGLRGFAGIAGVIRVEDNPQLDNLNGLAGLTGVPDSVDEEGQPDGLRIRGNDVLATLDGLEQLTTAYSVDIEWNPLLTNLRALGSLATVTSSTRGFTIANNASLPECEAQWLCGLVSSATCRTASNDASGVCP